VTGAVPYAGAVFPCDFPDPMVLKQGHAWFAYGTSTGWEHGVRSFPILRSTDLRHWKFVGDALSRPPRWAAGDLWGPSVIAWHGSYLLYYGASLRGRGPHWGPHCVAVARARRPQGPFRTLGRIACRVPRGRGLIDPAPLVAPGRRIDLFFSVDSPRHSISAVRLSANGLRATGRVHRLLWVSPRWGRLRSRTVEGPWPLRRRGRYYLFYSAGSWMSDYRMSYAVARHPLGPYRDTAPVEILRARKPLRSPGGGSVVLGAGGATWLAFHAWSGRSGYQFNSERTMRIAPLQWTRRGVPRLDLRGGK
jgi:beta-xylosidase